MPLLSDVLQELDVGVAMRVRDGSEELLLIAPRKYKGFPPPPHQCYTLAAIGDDPNLHQCEADAIRRRFKPPWSGEFISLGLADL